jgi:RNA polymerase sigma factor (sigma-70 family)
MSTQVAALGDGGLVTTRATAMLENAAVRSPLRLVGPSTDDPAASATGDDAVDRGVDAITAFAAFYRARHVEVYRYFHRQVLCPEIAADLTAETFAQALAHRDRYRAELGSREQWVFGIARNQLRMWARTGAAAERARRRLRIMTPAFTQSDVDSVAQAADLDALNPSVQEALDALPASDRMIVRLRIDERLEYPDIAQALGCSVGAARVRSSRALARLRRELLARAPDAEERLE